MALKLNLNQADQDQLSKLPGIGPKLAARIVEYRSSVGRFRTLEELAAVPGISERMLDGLRTRAGVEGDAVEGSSKPLPPLKMRVLLTNPDGLPYTGHRLHAAYTKREWVKGGDGQLAALWVPASLNLALSAGGEASFELPHRDDLSGEVVFGVRSPDGGLLHEAALPAAKLPEVLKLAVVPAQFSPTTPNEDPTFGKPVRLKGRVIDGAGRQQVARRQVVIWAADRAEPQAPDFRALVAADTDANGYFGGPYPIGRFSAAAGSVAVGAGEPVSVPIHLNDDGSFPESVILVVAMPAIAEPEDEDECGCDRTDVPRDPDAADLTRADGTYSSDPGAGRCVDFTKPDRTLEEFTYSYVVRTTEPVIKGLTLQEPPKIDLSHLADVLAPRGQLLARSAEAAPAFATERIDARLLRNLVQESDGPVAEKVAAAAELTLRGDVLRVLGQRLAVPAGRTALSCANAIDWDEEPTIYQACTIAHGHLLRFKQEWVADGYSMGNLLYSLPLAPGQKKQIAVVDWERREVAARSEELEEREALDAAISRDRDINEIVNGTVSESVRGGSRASTASIAGGFAAPIFGGLLGIGGGASSASSSAFQDSSRNTAASALNQLRDRTIQSASALRSQRSTVVQTTRQGERIVATTETVANYNHCHAITIQYFEVLRHLLVRQRLVDVQECLFVPLLMSRFNSEKALRWRNTLEPAVPARYRGGFLALERIKAQYVGSDLPLGTYADQTLENLDGQLYLRFEIARPKDDANDEFDPNAWLFLSHLFPVISASDFHRQYLKGQALKDRIFQEQMAPRIAERFVQHLRFHAVDFNDQRTPLPIDTTLVSDYVPERPLFVSLRLKASLPALVRKSIKAIEISERSTLLPLPLFQILPPGSKVIVTNGTMAYRTRFSSGHLFRDAPIQNDLVEGDGVRVDCPLSREELRNPREEDKELSRRLLAHLNEHLEPLHHRLWSATSRDRLYMLLDGFEAPNAGGRSVASVVQLELIGIVGNSLVLPVAPGFHLDPTFRQDGERPIDLIEHYQPNTPIEPSRVAIPTRGVYAEAVMGACNSCERKEEERFWRWEESPLPDQPPPILPVSTETRRAEPPDLTAKDFPTPIINLQNAPAAPDPTGLAAAMQLLGTPGLFKDITGLEGNQRNAAEALKQAFSTAQFFGGKAAELALQQKMARDIDKAMRTIASAKQGGLISDTQAQELTRQAIGGMIGAGTEDKPKPLATAEEVGKIANSAAANKADITVKRPDGETVEAKTLEQRAGQPAETEIVLSGNSADLRTFLPSRNDKTGRIRVNSTVSSAPPTARFEWRPQHADRVQVVTPNAGSTDLLALAPGRTSVTLHVSDGGNTLRFAHMDLCVPMFFHVTEFAGPAYAALGTAVANPHLFNTLLSEFHLAGQKNDVLTTARLVAEFLLRQANVRLVWSLAPFNEALPAQYQPGGAASAALVPLALAGFTRATLGAGTVGNTAALVSANTGLPTSGSIEIFPGGLDSGIFAPVAPLRAKVGQLVAAVAASPGNAALAAELARVRGLWLEMVGRVIGLSIAHEVHHMILGTVPGAGGHTTAPDIDLLSSGAAIPFARWCGIETPTPLPANFPDVGTFTDRGFNGLAVIGEANQGRVDALLPVPPAFPFG
jgi:competence ComEA-like helix-hairpin-helix protein